MIGYSPPPLDEYIMGHVDRERKASKLCKHLGLKQIKYPPPSRLISLIAKILISINDGIQNSDAVEYLKSQ